MQIGVRGTWETRWLPNLLWGSEPSQAATSPLAGKVPGCLQSKTEPVPEAMLLLPVPEAMLLLPVPEAVSLLQSTCSPSAVCELVSEGPGTPLFHFFTYSFYILLTAPSWIPSYIPSTFLLLFSPEHVRATCVLPPVPPTLACQVSVRLELPLPLRPHKAAQLEGSPARTYSTYRQQLLGTHPVGVLQDPHENQAAHLLHKCREYKVQPFIFFACWVRH